MSLDVFIENVTTVPAAPLTARFDVHVITAVFAAVNVAPIVTVNTAPTVAAEVTVLAAPSLVAVHVVAASALNRFADGVIVTVPLLATATAGVKVTTRFPPATPVS